MINMDGGFLVDCPEVRAIGSQLRSDVSGLDETAAQGPPAPGAGSSSAQVADTLASIMRAVAGLISGVGNTVSQIGATDDTYRDADKHGETGLRHTGGG